MKRRICSLIAITAICFSLIPAPVFAAAGFSNFSEINVYNGQFTDVPSNAWYAESVASAYRLGLVAGTSATTFNPDGNLKISEVITLACSLHSRYHDQDIPAASGGPWYQQYVDYALTNGLITTTYADYSRSATRAECVTILARSLPAAGFAEINNIPDGAIPDVPMTVSYAGAVYKFYRAGIMQGYTGGEFRPSNYIRRCEIAATLLRIADPTIRGEFTLEPAKDMTADKISEKCAKAVFYIEVYDANGDFKGSGSGFFIDSSGVAITNYHVINGASYAKVLLTDGSVYDVEGVYDYDTARDIAMLKIEGSKFDVLAIGDSDKVVAGQTVFAIGSPQGLDNTISQGIISNVSRLIGGQNFIQTTAQISPGSSGGALLNAQGEVIGITSAYINLEGSQNLNLAIPINDINGLSRSSLVTLASIADSPDPSLEDLVLAPDYDSVTLAADSGFNLYVYAAGPFETVFFESKNTDIVTAEWGEWDDYGTVPLVLYSGRKGTTTIELTLRDAKDNVLLTKNVTVTVVDRSYNNAFSLSDTALNLSVGQTSYVMLRENFSDYVSAHWDSSDTDVASCEWGEWDEDTIPLYITGESAGSAVVTVDLISGNKYVGSREITVNVVNNTKLTVSKSSVSLSVGASDSTIVKHNFPGIITVYYYIGDTSVVSCEWGEWEDDYTVPLSFTGLSSGTTSVVLDLYDEDDRYLCSTTVNVTVK